MLNRWKLSLAVVGIATTFTFVASAGFLRTAGDDGDTATPSAPLPPLPPSPLPPLPPSAPAPNSTTAEAAAVVITDVGNRPQRELPRELDSADPWTSSPRTFATTPRARKRKPLPLDMTDPWSAAPSERAAPPPTTPSRLSDDVLREAIKHAVDAGDLDRAARLLEILRTPR